MTTAPARIPGALRPPGSRADGPGTGREVERGAGSAPLRRHPLAPALPDRRRVNAGAIVFSAAVAVLGMASVVAEVIARAVA